MLRRWLIMLLCCTGIPAHAEPRPLRIALAMNQDPGFVFTQTIIRGTELAAEYIKKAYGREIVFTKADTGTSPEQTQKVMRDLVKADVDFIIGDIYSSQAAIGAMIAEQAGKVYMLTTSASPEITQGRRFIFRNCYSDEQFADAATTVLTDIDRRAATVVYDSSRLYGTSEKDAFVQRFRSSGRTTNVQELNRLTFAYEPHIESLKRTGSDALFLALDSVQAMVYLAKLHLSGHTETAVIGSSRFANPRIEGALLKLRPAFPVYWLANAPMDLTRNPRYGGIARDYRQKFNTPMNALGSLGFDAVMIFFEAVRDKENFSQEQVADGIRSIKRYQGLSADFSYNGRQDPAKTVFLRYIQDGQVAERPIAP